MEIPLDSGELTFQLTVKNSENGDATGESYEWHVDLITAKLAAEELEKRHRLKIKSGEYIPKLEFLTDLAEAYRKLGAIGCTPTAAKTIWICVAAKFAQMSEANAKAVEKLLK